MANEETFRPRRPNRQQEEQAPPFEKIEQMRAAANAERDEDESLPPMNPAGNSPMAQHMPFEIGGMENAPEAFKQAMRAARGQDQEPKRGFGAKKEDQRHEHPLRNFDNRAIASSGQLKELLEGLKGSTSLYEPIELPSKGRFYDGENGPSDGVLHIRPMTGEEEQILATPRFVRKGQAINMIFSKCIKENYRPEQLLTIDRTYLLIYLRGISYSHQYDVEIKCQECEKRFATTIDLNSLYVESVPDTYGPILEDVLPTSKYRFAYRLAIGKDEQDIQDYRDRRSKMFGDAATDDTLTYRTAQLIEHIEGLTNKKELQTLLKSLPINDVSYIRNCINDPPFGVDTDVEIICPMCLHEFKVDMPLEANFFFPRRKKDKTQA